MSKIQKNFMQHFDLFLAKTKLVCPFGAEKLSFDRYTKTWLLTNELSITVFLSPENRIYAFSENGQPVFYVTHVDKKEFSSYQPRAEYEAYLHRLSDFEKAVLDNHWKVRTMHMGLHY